MAEKTEQVRLAITIFDDLERLWTTVLALLRNGLTVEQICLMAADTTMQKVRPPETIDADEADRNRLSGLCETVESWPGAIDGHLVVATSGPLLDTLRATRTFEATAETKPRVFTSRGENLLEPVANGATVLVVRSLEAKQQSLVTRTLLSSSVHRVTTHDFSAPA